MPPRISLDRYIYEDIYPAFKAATDEKEITAQLVRAVLNHPAVQQQSFNSDRPALVADIGSGPADTIVKYLTGVHCPGGLIIRATDFLSEYADSEHGEALRNLAEAKARGAIPLLGYSARAGDAFRGDLRDLLRAPDGNAPSSDFRLVVASHVMYHADSADNLARLLGAIAVEVLAPAGLAILFHIANTPGTFQEFRARFGSEGAAGASDTGAVAIDDPPAQIRRACNQLKLPLHEIEFLSRLRFGELADPEWRAFKDPAQYDGLSAANPAAYEDLQRLYFIVQRAPLEFAADQSATGLSAFIDQIRALLERTAFALPLGERMQVFTRADAPAALIAALPAALAAAAASLNRG